MRQVRDCRIHPTARVSDFVNLYECELAEDVFVGPFVEIQRGVRIGPGSRVSSHSFVCEGVVVGANCFIGHAVVFTNDLFDTPVPNAGDFVLRETVVGDNVRIGSNATILPVRIGDDAIVGAGAVVTRDVPPRGVVAGSPARLLRSRDDLP